MPKLREAPVYVVHALHGYEFHGERVEREFAQQGIAFEWATEGDVSKMTDAILDRHFTPELQRSHKRGYLSCYLNHLLLYAQVVESGAEYAVIFEDDPCFLQPFYPALETLEAELRSLPPGVILSLENSTLRFPSFWQTKRGKRIYRASSGRCTGAYLIDQHAAQVMAEAIDAEPCDRPIGHWHNQLTDQGRLRTYWAHPPLIEQGSHNGLLTSTISTQARSWPRRISWLAQRAMQSSLGRILPQKRVFDD